jgi:hypothetical protein
MFGLKLKREGDSLVSVREQRERPLILDTVARVRAAGGVADREGLGRWALSISFEDWIRLREKYPELASNDPKIKSRAYLRFMRSPESIPFRVREKI